VKRILKWLQLELFGSDPEIQPQPTSLVPETRGEIQPLVWAALLQNRKRPIVIEFSRRSTQSWNVTWNRKIGLIRIRAPALLRDAPLEIAQALITWAEIVATSKKTVETQTLRRHSEGKVRAFLDQANHQGKPGELLKLKASRALKRMQPQGRHHDLLTVFKHINDLYFEGRLKAELTWSARVGGLSTHCERPHPDGSRYHLITISRGYDSPDVTLNILGGVVYHECLHIVHPPLVGEGRRVVHGRDFRRAEKAYQHYEEWMRWHRHGLHLSLRRLRRQEAKTLKTQR
jgi:hypothetical protein